MKKLVILSLFLAATASAQSVNICTNSSGNSRQPGCNASNQLEVDVKDLTPGTGATDLGKAEDGTPANGETGVVVYGIARSAITATATTTGKYGPPHIDSTTGAYFTSPIGSTARVCVDITPDTNAYAAGDIVGGLLTFANAVRAVTLGGTLQAIEVWGSEVDGIGYTFCPFTANPTASTVADQGALVVHVDDRAKWEGCISVATGTALAASEMYEANGIGKPIKLAATSMYGVLRTVGAPTWAAAQKLSVCAVIYQD